MKITESRKRAICEFCSHYNSDEITAVYLLEDGDSAPTDGEDEEPVLAIDSSYPSNSREFLVIEGNVSECVGGAVTYHFVEDIINDPEKSSKYSAKIADSYSLIYKALM